MRISDWSSDVCSSDLDWLVRRRGRAVRCLLGIAALLGWFVGGHLLLATLYRPAATARPAAVTMLTSLPLRWAQGDDMAAMIAQGADEDPALLRLEAAGPVQLVDSLADIGRAHVRTPVTYAHLGIL